MTAQTGESSDQGDGSERPDGLRETVATLEIVNEKGLHARASARFAAVAESYNASITVSRENLTVNGTSIMGLLMLAAAKGSAIQLKAEGPEASQAVDALRALVETRFGESA